MRLHPEWTRTVHAAIQNEPLPIRVATAAARGNREARLAIIRERLEKGFYHTPAAMHALAGRLVGHADSTGHAD